MASSIETMLGLMPVVLCSALLWVLSALGFPIQVRPSNSHAQEMEHDIKTSGEKYGMMRLLSVPVII